MSAPAPPPEKPRPQPAAAARPARNGKPRLRRVVDLALQGGGSHGAYTWGVLDALLEDGRIGIDGVSGTSAGAMNGAVLATGFARGGREGARQALRGFWEAVGGVADCFGPAAATRPAAVAPAAPAAAPPGAWPAWLFNPGRWPLYGLWDSWSRAFSPYQFNPLNLNPLRALLERHVDLALLRQGPLKLFITATSLSTGQPRVFSGDDLSIEALLASACIPQLFQAVEIDGEAYWDGGYSGNPALWPLIYETEAIDVLLVQINPLVRPGIPRTAVEIADRVNEITFNAGLVSELRAIAFVKRLVQSQRLDPSRYKALRLHRIADEGALAQYDAGSKLSTDLRLLRQLHDLGRASAQAWLAAHAEDVGVRASLDIEATFLAPRHAPAPRRR